MSAVPTLPSPAAGLAPSRPLPWVYDAADGMIADADGQVVAERLRLADAAFIVAACNAALAPPRSERLFPTLEELAATAPPSCWLVARTRDQLVEYLCAPPEDATRETPPIWGDMEEARRFSTLMAATDGEIVARYFCPRDLISVVQLPAQRRGR